MRSKGTTEVVPFLKLTCIVFRTDEPMPSLQHLAPVIICNDPGGTSIQSSNLPDKQILRS